MTDEAAALASLLAQPALAAVLDALDGQGEETRVVGGAVRDALLGRAATDVDLATTATPDAVMRRAAEAGFRTMPTGLDHGTVTVLAGGRTFEVTTLREDIATDGRHAVVRFGRDFAADAARRDFTINALSLDRDGRVHDLVGGVPDLRAARVRFIGDPARRICEDYLRILRLFRFHAAYGRGPIDREGLKACLRERAGIALLSRERIGAEIRKLLAAPGALEVVGEMSDAGFVALVLGGVADLGRLGRAMSPAAPFEPSRERALDPVGRLAALAITTPEDAERLRERLRLSNEDAARLVAFAAVVARVKSAPDTLDAAAMRRLVAEFGVTALVDAVRAVEGEPRPVLGDDGRQALAVFADGTEPPPALPIRGADLLAHGVQAGRAVGRGLAQAREAWLSAGCPSDAAEWLLPIALAAVETRSDS